LDSRLLPLRISETLKEKMSTNLKSQNLLLDLLIAKKWQWFRHITMLIILAISFYPDINAAELKVFKVKNPEILIKELNMVALAIFLLSLILLYFNLFVLIPKLLFKNKYIAYFFACFSLAIINFFSDYFISKTGLEEVSKFARVAELSFKSFIDTSLLPVIFLSATAGHQIFKKWINDSKLLAEMKEAKIQEELTNLKNQINPHFLFNTLNNLNTLIYTNPSKASAVVLGLSDVLRYQLYEANAEKVLLKKDIENLQQFLELGKIRRDNFQFGITIDGDISAIMVPPFIFTNFVENAVKHSTDNKAFSFVSIHFSIKNKTLYFVCKNSIPALTAIKKTGGLGLQNIKRRLQLLYDNAYQLHIIEDGKEFTINLNIPI
jgi:sensor histidine kinase YesM